MGARARRIEGHAARLHGRHAGGPAARLHARSPLARRRRLLAGRLAAAGVVTLLVLGVVLVIEAGPVGGNPAGGRGTSPASGRAIAPVLRSRLAAVMRFPGKLGRLPLPAKGEAAVIVPGLGIVGATPNERQRPIASLTKLMTAYIILKDHPLSISGNGPIFEMTAADHRAWLCSGPR